MMKVEGLPSQKRDELLTSLKTDMERGQQKRTTGHSIRDIEMKIKSKIEEKALNDEQVWWQAEYWEVRP